MKHIISKVHAIFVTKII